MSVRKQNCLNFSVGEAGSAVAGVMVNAVPFTDVPQGRDFEVEILSNLCTKEKKGERKRGGREEERKGKKCLTCLAASFLTGHREWRAEGVVKQSKVGSTHS